MQFVCCWLGCIALHHLAEVLCSHAQRLLSHPTVGVGPPQGMCGHHLMCCAACAATGTHLKHNLTLCGLTCGVQEVVSDGKAARAASPVPSGPAAEESSPSLVEPPSTDVSADSAVIKIGVSDTTPPLPTASKPAGRARRKPSLLSSAATMAAAAKEAMSGAAATAGSSKVAEAVAAAPDQAAEAATAVETGVREAVGAVVKAVK